MKFGKLYTGDINSKAKNYSQMPAGNTTPDRDSIRDIVGAPDDTSDKLDGMIRYNTDKDKLEVHHLGVWTELISLMDIMNSDDLEFYDPKGNATVQELAKMLSEFLRVEMGTFDVVHKAGTARDIPSYDDLNNITPELPTFIDGFNYTNSGGAATHVSGVVEDINVSRAYVEPIIGTGRLNTIRPTTGGSGYTEPPEVYIYGGGGTGALVDAIISDGKVVDFKIVSRGIDYTSKPTVLITGGGGEGATVEPADVTLGDGKILGMRILSGGSGYGTLPRFTVDGTRTTDAIVEPVVNNGTIVDFKIIDQGDDYTEDAYLTMPKQNTYMRSHVSGGTGHGVWFRVNFKFDVFNAAGVKAESKKDYRINLFSGLSKYFDWVCAINHSSYAGIPIIRSANMKPLWTSGDDMYDDPNYGKFEITVDMHGAAAYYSSSVSLTWASQLVKFRNF